MSNNFVVIRNICMLVDVNTSLHVIYYYVTDISQSAAHSWVYTPYPV